MQNENKLFSYENRLLLLLGFTFGIVFFERNAVGNLAGLASPAMQLNFAPASYGGVRYGTTALDSVPGI